MVLTEKNRIEQELDQFGSFSRNETLVSNTSFDLGPGGNHTLIYTLQHAGYLEINFNATTEIYMWIGNSLTENYYSRYPNFPETADTGRFIVPASHTVYVFLVNPDQSSSEITITIEYVY